VDRAERDRLLAQLTETVPVGLFQADLDGNLMFSNRKFQEIMGSSDVSALDDLLAAVRTEDRLLLQEAVSAAEGGADADAEVGVGSGPETTRHCAIRIRPVRDHSGAVIGLIGWVDDVTRTVRARRELEARADSDPLTGCLNRTAALTMLQAVLDNQRGAESGTAVIFIDLDRFKPINDRHGHAAGDKLLVDVAERIRSSIRAEDVVSRFGGDEFVVVCSGVADEDHALVIAEALAARVPGPIVIDGLTVEVRASLGVAWSPMPGLDAAQLVYQADRAMYESKRLGRSHPVMGSSSARRLTSS
jgi:diguanylate cyclase (GGDEF)-like protein/PAS domain S-box-containing protein